MDWYRFWNESPQVHDSDVCRQVGRTFKGVGYSERELDALVRRIVGYLDAAPDQSLLDLACGNGLLTHRYGRHFAAVTGVDYSAPLIAVARRCHGGANIEYVLDDATLLTQVDTTFDRVLLSAALQHFNRGAALRLFRRLQTAVKPNGRIVLADVADGGRKWRFYRGVSGRLRYGRELLTGRATIGWWWTPSALARVAAAAGWEVSVRQQPEDAPNHYFRYDAVLERSPSLSSSGSKARRSWRSSGKPGTIRA